MISEDQARAIALLVSQVRPEWLQSSIVTLIGRQARDADPAVVTVALLLAARDEETRTPGRALAVNGPVWARACQALQTHQVQQPARPPMRGEECRTHPGQWARGCTACATDDAVRAAQEAQQAACAHETAQPVTYTARGPRGRQIDAWHCPECDLINDTDPR